MISIIVPVYNVENYLRQCIDSLCNQIYKDIEIILVDDGSTDTSFEICKELSDKDRRIHVIHHERCQGLSSAKNDGIQQSKGEFIGFVDSDDYVSPDMFNYLFELISLTNADISICNYYILQENYYYLPFRKIKETEHWYLSGDQRYDLLYYNSIYGIVSWNKLYKRDLFNDVMFPINRVHEDNFIIHNLLGNAWSVCLGGKPCYYYRIRKNSITDKADSKSVIDDLSACRERISYFELNNMENYRQKEVVVYLSRLISLYDTVLVNYPKDSEKLSYIYDLFSTTYKAINRKSTGLINYISFIVFKHNARFGAKCRSTFKNIIKRCNKIVRVEND